MKTVIALLTLIVAIILADHFHLLDPRPQYPEHINRLLSKLNRETPIITPEKASTENPPQPVPQKEKKLYQWRDEQGTWQISDTPPQDRVYQTINLSDNPESAPKPETVSPDVPATPSEAELKNESQCKFYLEQVDYYKRKMRFGGPGHVMDHWQNQVDWYRKLALQTCTGKPMSANQSKQSPLYLAGRQIP